MKSNLSAIALLLAFAGATAPAFARHRLALESPRSVELKDGGILHVFKDGKMAKENKYGRVEYLGKGEVLEAADGRRVTVVGNETAKLDLLLNDEHRY
ncbi:MAG: CopK family periplasmic copper-binding protein [Rubrivivax sp.]|nr:CopK family periplasmic copper-binding protein [Rubrivivax sp.]